MLNAFSPCRPSACRSAFVPAAAVLALLFGLAPHLVRAQTTITWVGTTADFATAANWSSAAVPGAADIARFSGTPAATTVTLGGATSLTGLAFAADAAAHTLDATAGLTLGDSGLTNAAATAQTISGSLTLGTAQIFNTSGTGGTTVSAALALGGHTLIVSGAGNTTLSGVVSGSGGLIKSGTGTLTLSGANTHSGTTTVSNGTLAASAATLGSGALSVTGGALNLSGAFSASRAVTVDGATASFTTASYLEIGGASTGSLTIAQGGTVTSGATIASSMGSGVNSSISVTGTGSSLTAATTLYVGYTGSSTLTIGSGGTVTANTLTLGAVAGSSGTLNLETGGTLSLVGGTVEHYVAGAGTAIINFSGGTLRTTVDGGSFYDITAPVTLTAGTTTTIDLPGDPFNGGSAITGVVSGSGNLLKTGTGTFYLTADNTYTGNTVVNGGYIGFFAAGAPGTSALGTGTITLDGGGLRFAQTGCEDFSARLAPIGAGGASFAVDVGASVTFGTALTGSGPVTMTGGGKLTVASSAALGTGSLAVTGGTLHSSGNFSADRAVSVGGDANFSFALLESAGYMEFGKAANGSLTVTAGGHVTSASSMGFGMNWGVTGTGSVTGTNSSLTVPTTLYLGNFGAIPSGIGHMGTGLLTIGSGGTVSANLVLLQGVGSSLTLNAGGTLVLTGTDSVLFNFSNGAVTFAGGTIRFDGNGGRIDGNALQLAAGTTSTFNTNGHDANLWSEVGGAGGLLKTGAGKLTLSPSGGYNTYAGGTTVTGGTLSVNQNAYLGAASGGVTLDGGTLQLNSDNYIRVITLGSSGGTIDRANNPTYDPIVWAGAVSGPGALTLSGAGSLALTGTNTYAGGTTVTGGTLQIGADANLGAAAGTVTLAGTTLATTGSFSANRATTLGTGGATFNTAAGTTVDWQGVVSGSTALVKTGAGILALTGANTYAGGTTVTGGLAEFSTLGNLGSGTVTLDGGGLRWATGATTDPSARLATLGAGGATFDTHGNNVTFATALTGSSPVTKTGAGTLTVASPTALGTGALTITGGTLQGSADFIADRAVTIAGAGATLASVGYTEFGHNANGSLALSGGGAVTSASSVAFGVLGGVNGTGSVTGTGSTLTAPTALFLGYLGTGTLTVGSGGTVTTGQVRFGDYAGGVGTLNLETGGTLAVGGTDGLRGGSGGAAFNFAGGTIRATSALTTALPLALANATSSTVDTNGQTATFSGVLSGAGALVKAGTGALTLTGANTYTGGTLIDAGTVRIGNATGSAFGTGAVTIGADGLLTGAGTFSGALQNNGIYSPGNSPMLATLSSFSQGSTGFLQMELGGLARGTQYDALDVTGALTFGGTLAVSFIDGFTASQLSAGTMFNLFDWGGASGTFAFLDLPALGSGLSWDASELYTTGALGVSLAAVPEPSTYAALAGLAALGAAVWRRRRSAERLTAPGVVLPNLRIAVIPCAARPADRCARRAATAGHRRAWR